MGDQGQRPRNSIENSLTLEDIDKNLFRANTADLWKPYAGIGIFGGQIIGLALVAATKTVDPKCIVNSLHSHFVNAGDPTTPIIFHVNRVRNGRSFVVRQVTAYQRGSPIFLMVCSFQYPEVSPLIHQYSMPVAPDPETLPTQEQELSVWKHKIPKKYHNLIEMRIADPIPIEIRHAEKRNLKDLVKPSKKEPKELIWLKSRSKLPDDPAFHMCVAAYSSDHQLLWTTLRAHGITGFSNPRLKVIASLDHSMWFHEPFRADEWLLYEMESPRAIGGRGLALGRLWTRDGRLVCSCAQEGLIRVKLPSPKALSRPDDEENACEDRKPKL